MADTNLTRTYTIPLRKRFVDVPRYKRAKRAVKTVRLFLEKHMKSETIKLGPKLNEKLWVHGIKNPPARVTVTASKDKDGLVRAELEGYEYVDFKVKEKTEKNASMQEKLKQKVQGAKSDASGDESSSQSPASSGEAKTASKTAGESASEGASSKTASKATSKKAASGSSSTKKTASKKTASKKTASKQTVAKNDSDATASSGKPDSSASDK